MKGNFLYFLKLNNSHQWSKKHPVLHRQELQLLPLPCHFRARCPTAQIDSLTSASPWFSRGLSHLNLAQSFPPPYCLNRKSDLEELALQLVTAHQILLCFFCRWIVQRGRSLHFTSLPTLCSPCTGGSADLQRSELWASCTEVCKESHPFSTPGKIYLESFCRRPVRWIQRVTSPRCSTCF